MKILSEHTARLLHDLGRIESLRGLALPEAEKLSTKQETILRFLQRISEINPGTALLMATTFKTLREILNRCAPFRFFFSLCLLLENEFPRKSARE